MAARWLVAVVFLAWPMTIHAGLTAGPTVGATTSDRAQVMVATDTPATVQVRFATDPALQTFTLSPEATTESSQGFAVKLDLVNLVPITRYHYDVLLDGVSQFGAPFPSFVTFAPATDAHAFKFIVLTDFAERETAPLVPTFASAMQEGADFVFIGGDFDHREMTTLDGFRDRYRLMLNPATRGLSEFAGQILRSMSLGHQYDDHDSGVDNGDKTNPFKADKLRAYRELIPHYPLPQPGLGIWQSFRHGQVEFFVLDNRSQRDPRSSRTDPSRSMLDGDALGASGQLQWLLNGLAASTARWKVIFSSVILNPTTKPTDGWAAFPEERQTILNVIQTNGVTGVIVVSGDLHMGGIDNGTTSGLPEIVVPGPDLPGCLSARNPGIWSEGIYGKPGPCRGYGVVEFTTNPDAVRMQIKDLNGQLRLEYALQ